MCPQGNIEWHTEQTQQGKLSSLWSPWSLSNTYPTFARQVRNTKHETMIPKRLVYIYTVYRQTNTYSDNIFLYLPGLRMRCIEITVEGGREMQVKGSTDFRFFALFSSENRCVRLRRKYKNLQAIKKLEGVQNDIDEGFFSFVPSIVTVLNRVACMIGGLKKVHSKPNCIGCNSPEVIWLVPIRSASMWMVLAAFCLKQPVVKVVTCVSRIDCMTCHANVTVKRRLCIYIYIYEGYTTTQQSDINMQTSLLWIFWSLSTTYPTHIQHVSFRGKLCIQAKQ